jgi:hypothetical protein
LAEIFHARNLTSYLRRAAPPYTARRRLADVQCPKISDLKP